MTSNIPATLNALFTIAQTANPGVQVVFGPPLNNSNADYICIGFNDGDPAVQATQTVGDLAEFEDIESFTVFGRAVSWRGTPDLMGECVTSAFGMADAFETAVRADPTLGGTVMQVAWASANVDMPQTEKGPVCAVLFTVTVAAWRT